MKVSMLTETNWDGEFVKIGDELEVSPEVGERWKRYKIAVPIETEDEGKTLSVTELKAIAKNLGIEGYTKMNKDQLITAIAGVEESETKLDGLRAKALSFGITSVETMTKEELEEVIFLGTKAIELNIQGHETMTKEQLIEAIAEKTKLNESNGQA